MQQGSALLFEGLTAKHYPVYLHASLVNTNAAFDFSPFAALAVDPPAQFIFTFQDAGVYMFGDAETPTKTTVVAVMADSQKCPADLLYEAKTQAALLKAGIAIRKDLVYSPEWGFFFGIVAAVLVLITLSVFVVGYVYTKSWEVLTGRNVKYQAKQYAKVQEEDPENPDALVSINADA